MKNLNYKLPPCILAIVNQKVISRHLDAVFPLILADESINSAGSPLLFSFNTVKITCFLNLFMISTAVFCAKLSNGSPVFVVI